jgi:hypothetical protein
VTRARKQFWKIRREPHLLSSRGLLESKSREANEPVSEPRPSIRTVALFFDLALAGRPNGRTQELLIPEANRHLTHDVGSVWQDTRYSSPRPPGSLLPMARPDQACPIGIGQGLGWVEFSAKMMLKKPLDGLERTSKIACFPHSRLPAAI